MKHFQVESADTRGDTGDTNNDNVPMVSCSSCGGAASSPATTWPAPASTATGAHTPGADTLARIKQIQCR